MSEKKNQSARIQSVAYKGYADGSVDFFGPQIELLTGYTRDEFLSRKSKWTDLIFQEDRPYVKTVFVDALKGDKTYNRQYRIHKKNGDILWIQEWGQIVCDAEGKVEYVIGIIVDITDLKLSEELDLRIKKRSGKYLIFILNQQDYAFPIHKVKEIVGALPITPMPQAPAYIRGVINLRGRIIPVADLYERLSLKPEGVAEKYAIIILEAQIADSIVPIGVLVDSVSEVLNIDGEHIEDVEDVFAGEKSHVVSGMAKSDQRVILILNVDHVIETQDIYTLNIT